MKNTNNTFKINSTIIDTSYESPRQVIEVLKKDDNFYFRYKVKHKIKFGVKTIYEEEALCHWQVKGKDYFRLISSYKPLHIKGLIEWMVKNGYELNKEGEHMNKKEQKQKSKLGAKSKIKLKNYNKGVKTNKGNKRFKQIHNENEVNKAMAELSDGELKESSIQELENDIQEVLDETSGVEGIDDEFDFKKREQESWEEDSLKEATKSFRDKLLAGVIIGGLLALAFVDIFFNK